MFTVNFEKMARIGIKNMGYFTNMAKDFVEYGMGTESGEPMGDKVEEFFTETLSIGMAMGEAVTKKQHIVTGVVIGVAGTVITSKISNKLKKNKEEKELKEALQECSDYIINELENDDLKIRKK